MQQVMLTRNLLVPFPDPTIMHRLIRQSGFYIIILLQSIIVHNSLILSPPPQLLSCATVVHDLYCKW